MKVVLVVTAALVVGLIAAGKPLMLKALRPLVIAQLSSKLKAKVTLDELDISFIPPAVTIEGLEVYPREGPLRYLGVGRGIVRPGFGPFFLGRIVISSVEVEDPVLKVELSEQTEGKTRQEKSDRFLKIPTLKDILKIDLRKVTMSGARLAVRFPFKDVELHIGSGSVKFEGDGGIEKWVWNGKGEIRRKGEALPVEDVSIVAERVKDLVTIQKFDVKAPGFDFQLSGQAYPEADLTVKVGADLASVEKTLHSLKILSAPLGLSGQFDLYNKTEGPWTALKWAGKVSATDLLVKKRKFRSVETSFRVRHQLLEKLSGQVSLGSSAVHFSIRGLRAGALADFSVTGDAIPYEAIQLAIDPENVPRLHGPVTVRASGQLGVQPAQIQGSYEVSVPSLAVTLPPVLEPYLPLEFKQIRITGNIGMADGKGVWLESGKVSAAGLGGDYRFNFLPGGEVKAVWNAVVTDVGKFFREGDDTRGAGIVGGGLQAKGKEYRAIVDLKLDTLSTGPFGPSRADAKIIFERGVTRLSGVRLRNLMGVAQFDADFPFELDEPTRIEARWHGLSFGWIAHVARRRYPFLQELEGISTGSLVMNGPSDQLSGSLRTYVSALKWRGEKYKSLNGAIDFEDGNVLFRNVRLDGNAGNATLKGTLDPEGLMDLEVAASQIPLKSFGLPEGLDLLATHVGGTLTFKGSNDDPETSTDVSLSKTTLTGEQTLVGAGTTRGKLSDLEWSLGLSDQAFVGSGRLSLVGSRKFTAAGKLSDYPLVFLFGEGPSRASADFELEGPLEKINEWNGKLSLLDFRIRKEGVDLSLGKTTDFALKKGELTMDEAELKGPSTLLKVKAAIHKDLSMEGKASGSIGLSALTLFPLKVQRGEGEAIVDIRLGGTTTSPRFWGDIKVGDGLLQFQQFPHVLQDIRLSATLDQQRISVDEVSAKIGDGLVRAAGLMVIGSSLDDTTIDLRGNADRVNWRFPAWIPATASGTLSLVGPLSRPLLRGELIVHEATYNDEWDWKSKVLTFGRTARRVRAFRPSEEHLRLDLHFRSDGDRLLLRNNIAKGTLRGDLRLVGSDRVMGLLGRVEVAEGKVRFLDNEFTITSGIVTFEDETGFGPIFDLQARTTVQDTNILLEIRTQKEEVLAFLSSQPPKDETNLVSLLTLGIDADELVQAGAGNQNLGATLVPSVLSAPIQSNLESGLKRARIVDTFQFIPYFSEDTRSTGLKMVVGKQLFPRVRLSYSTDLLNAGTENTVKLEQEFSRHISMQGNFKDNQEQDKQEVGVGVDFEFKYEF